MAKHMVKCLYCGQMFDANTEPFVKPNARRYAHVACARTEEENQTQEEKDKRELEEYIKELFGVSTIPIKIRKQMDTFRKEKNYSYSGMRKTLKFFFEVKGNPIEKLTAVSVLFLGYMIKHLTIGELYGKLKSAIREQKFRSIICLCGRFTLFLLRESQ